MSREVRFRVTDEEYDLISQHVSRKHRWKRVSDFARYSVFKEMDANKAGSHRTNGARPTPLDTEPIPVDS